jgi:hypothetical protein
MILIKLNQHKWTEKSRQLFPEFFIVENMEELEVVARAHKNFATFLQAWNVGEEITLPIPPAEPQ